jgi:predicted alpha/beta superfamily hydrolase
MKPVILAFILLLFCKAMQAAIFPIKYCVNSQSGTRIELAAHMEDFLRTIDEESVFEENQVLEMLPQVMPEKPRDSSASKNVHIVDTAFFIPQLNRYRRIWIYLPPSYSTSRKKFPVLYMQDGQNVFDNATSFSGEWGVDETIDNMAAQFGEMIVVAIDNGGEKRMSEYSPSDNKYAKAEGEAYVDFMVQTLRPYINKHYRTRKCGKHNYIAGSSMGALISFYALVKYPTKFGGAGIFSPSFWIAPEFKNLPAAKAKKIKGKIYLFAGMQESEHMVPDMLQVLENFKKYSKAEIKTVIRAEGKHSESTWREEFPVFYQWLVSK